MTVFAVKFAWALVMLNCMTRLCYAASAKGFCPWRTCGEDKGVEVRFPFRIANDALTAQCYTDYEYLAFQCLNSTLYLNFTSDPVFSSAMYKVLEIDYWNQTISLAPQGPDAGCRSFDAKGFGGLNITNTTRLCLNCDGAVEGSCSQLPFSFIDSCTPAGVGSNVTRANRFSCPVDQSNYRDGMYSTCHLFETNPQLNQVLLNGSYALELQFEGNRSLSMQNNFPPPAAPPAAALSPTPAPALPPGPTPVAPANGPNDLSNQKRIILGVVAGFLAAIIIFLSVMLYCCRRSSRSPSDMMRYDGDKKAFAKIRSNGSGHLTQLFTYKELDHATQNFSTKHELGGGGFGTVYKGKLSDGRQVAVKKLNQGGSQGIQQFLNEVEVLSKVRHPHLVQLLGCCMERPLLVYEFVPNGSISNHLHGGPGKAEFPWETRLEIAIQTAEALAYLHFFVDPPIFHRDVKTTNILLDKDFKVKIADFGLSRLVVNVENTHISTAPQGTPGYLDPDYHESYHLSDKSDVYSFGVVLMELVTAKKAVDMARERKEINLASLAVAKIHSGCLHEIIDPDLTSLFRDYPMAQVMVEQVAELAFRCLASEKDDRPSMKEVLAELQRIQVIGFGGQSAKKLETASSFDNNSAKPLIKKDGGWPASPTSVQDVWVSNTTSPADSLAEMA